MSKRFKLLSLWERPGEVIGLLSFATVWGRFEDHYSTPSLIPSL